MSEEKTEVPANPPPQPAPTNPLAGFCSEQIDKISAALAKAQGQIDSVKKDETAGDGSSKYSYTYATLAACWEACRKPLSENGLAIIQTTVPNTQVVRVVTILTHTSGQWFKSTIDLKPTKPDAQGFGSAMTYARRYALTAIVGLAPDDDDDAQAAVGKGQQKQQQQKKQPPPRKATDLVNQRELQQLFASCGEKNIDTNLMKEFFKLQFGYETSKQLTVGQWREVMKTVRHKDTDENTIGLIVDGLRAEQQMDQQQTEEQDFNAATGFDENDIPGGGF